MRNRLYILFSFIALMLWGCFDDKGNYDYKNVNDVVSLTFTPEPKITEYSYDYTYKQPSLDTLVVTYAPSVEQSMVEGENNLEFQWIMRNGSQWDTVFSKELVLKYPPKVKTSYDPLFRMIDHSTGVEYYRQFKMRTEVPFLASWFVLHGDMGNRKLGVVEGVNNEGDEPVVTLDAYENIWGATRFQNAVGLVYASADGVYTGGSVVEYEHLTVIQEDSLTYMYAFSLLPTKSFQDMMPLTAMSARLSYGVGDETQAATVLVTTNGKCFWARGLGYYFTMNTTTETENYVVDKLYITADHDVIIWDKNNACFYSYTMAQVPTWSLGDVHPGDDAYGATNTINFLTKEDGSDLFEEGEWDNQEVLYLGQGNNEISEYGVMILGRAGNNYTVYQLGKTKSDKGQTLSLAKFPLAGDLALDQYSQVATSFAYTDQFFFTRGESALYLYNIVTGEEKLLYDAGGRITKLKFRTSREDGNAESLGIIDPNNRLAMVVDKEDGTGELHEIYLSVGADVEETHVYEGFGTIQDIVFANFSSNKEL